MQTKTISTISAITLYAIISILYFGYPVLLHPTQYFSGIGNDPISFIWFIKWWEYAILHMKNPFLTHVVWYPHGVNLAQSTSIPLIGLAGLPITYFFSAIVTYNYVTVFAPALSAFTAFILCRKITNSIFPSLVGGYLFGFSTYQIAQMFGHLNLAMTFAIPLLVLQPYLYFNARMSNRRFILFSTLLLITQFLLSKEIFATFLFFGAIAICMSYFIFKEDKEKIVKLAKYSIIAILLSCFILSPYLYFFLKYPLSQYHNTPFRFSNDLLNFIIPTPLTFINADYWKDVSVHFQGNGGAETGAYFGIPWLLLIGFYSKEFRRTKQGKLLLIMFLVTALISLGPILHIAGYKIASNPWIFLSWLPVFGHALADRFVVYTFLITAIITALWIANSQKKTWLKLLLVTSSILLILPSMLYKNRPWYSPLPHNQFISSGDYRHWIKPHATVMVIPIGRTGAPTMYWQQQTNWYYNMTGGYVGEMPILANTYLAGKLRSNEYNQIRKNDIQKFIMQTHPDDVLMNQHAYQSPLRKIFQRLGYRILHIDNVYLIQLKNKK